MSQFFVRRWFLLLLLAGTALALICPGLFAAWTGRLEPRKVVALALFLIALTLSSRSLAREIFRPWAAVWALVLSYGLMPAAAWLVSDLLAVPDYRIGLLIITCVPCTMSSAVLWTRMAGGNEATALLAVMLSTGTSFLATTAWLALTTATAVALDPAEMMRDLLWTLVAPVALGQACRSVGPLVHTVTRFRTAIGVVSQVLVLAIVFKAAAQVGQKLAEGLISVGGGMLPIIAAVCIGLHVGTLAIGLWTSKWFACDWPQRIGVGFSASQKTLPVSLVLFEGYFQADYPLALVPLLLFHVGQLVLDTWLATHLARTRHTAAGP